jgi:Flp pilus assembly protein TadD
MRLSNFLITLLITHSMALVCSSALASPTDEEVKVLNKETEKQLQEKNYGEALTTASKALALDPNNVKALHKRVVIYMLMKQPEKARPDLEQLIKLAKTPAEVHAATAYRDSFYKDFKEAKLEIDKAIELEPKNYEFYGHRADILMHLKEYSPALSDADKAIEINPNFFGAYYARARIYEKMGKVKEAQADFATAEQMKAKFKDKMSKDE